ncbi:hypothetical protein EVAR_34012_1 [Eumeta japonica]|uniref:Uncharacterized protein n=1 Tax=Eumeta variegata TaxID=151549 RepID=A0A4C1VST3_EUMVA|nr:hypothetical protein EVAR_34012_1 [Eumeta japonica]
MKISNRGVDDGGAARAAVAVAGPGAPFRPRSGPRRQKDTSGHAIWSNFTSDAEIIVYEYNDFNRLKKGKYISEMFVVRSAHNVDSITSKNDCQNIELNEDARKIITQTKLYERDKLKEEFQQNISLNKTRESMLLDETLINDELAVLKVENDLLKQLNKELTDKNEILKEFADIKKTVNNVKVPTYAEITKPDNKDKPVINYKKLNRNSGQINWCDILNYQSPDEAVNLLIEKIHSIMEKSYKKPLPKQKKNLPRNDWVRRPTPVSERRTRSGSLFRVVQTPRIRRARPPRHLGGPNAARGAHRINSSQAPTADSYHRSLCLASSACHCAGRARTSEGDGIAFDSPTGRRARRPWAEGRQERRADLAPRDRCRFEFDFYNDKISFRRPRARSFFLNSSSNKTEI